MAVLKYKDPETGEVKTVGAPSVDAYSKGETDTKLASKAPMYSYSTDDLEAGVTPLESGKLHFVYD